MSQIPDRASRLLIVDDDEGVRCTFAAILKRKGHEAFTASSADEGLRDVSTVRPDAILLDLRMPMVNGFGFLYRLRSDPTCADLPVAIVTGDGSPCGVMDFQSLKPETIDGEVAAFFAPLDAERRDCLIAFGWGMAEDLAAKYER